MKVEKEMKYEAPEVDILEVVVKKDSQQAEILTMAIQKMHSQQLKL